MILLRVKHVLQINTKIWAEDVWKDKIGPQVSGETPAWETGSVTLLTEIVMGNWDAITDLYDIDEEPTKGILKSIVSLSDGQFKIEISFYDGVYLDGFERSITNIFQKNTVLLGLNRDDYQNLRSPLAQKRLLEMLFQELLPEFQKQALEWILPAYILVPSPQHEGTKFSHFLGIPKLPVNTSYPYTLSGKPLFHIATLDTHDFDWSLPNVRYLSFYINIYDAELQFPENKDEFVVFSCDRLAANNSIDMPFYMDETGVNIAPFLDIPDVGHCLFFDVNWSNQQRAIYHNISFFYKKMIFHGLEDNQGYNKFLGYPDSVQSCVALNAEKIFNGKQHEEWLYQAAKDWRLLLQVSPNKYPFSLLDQLGICSIFFMIKSCDLEAGVFDQIQVVVQNT